MLFPVQFSTADVPRGCWAVDQGGHFVSITDKQEQDFVVSLTPNTAVAALVGIGQSAA